MESQKDIIQKFIEQNESQIHFYDGKSYATYKPHVNPLLNLSSFAKSKGSKNGKELTEQLFETLSNTSIKPEKIQEAQEIIKQLMELFQEEKIKTRREEKTKEQERIFRENNEKIRGEINKKEKIKTEELAIRQEKREKKEEIEKKLSFKKRMIDMGVETDRHIDTIIDALLQDDKILGSFLDSDSVQKIREKGKYETPQRELENPRIRNIVKRFKKKMKDETLSIPNLETIKKKPRTHEPEIEVTYKNYGVITTIDEKTYNVCEEYQRETKRLLENKFEIRSRLFGRVIEYIQMDILKEKLRPHMKSDFTILKTDIVDDTMTGIDFVLVYDMLDENQKIMNKQCFIDATTALSDETLTQKSENAKNKSTPYNYFIERIGDLCEREETDKKQILPTAEKFVEESEEYTTPYLISKALERIEEGKPYTSYIKDFFATEKGKITSESMDFQRYLPSKEKYRTKDIIDQAKRIDIKKIKELSIAA